ncbi:MAG: glycosyltransferase family 2 protein [Verrucomicrobiota bacterium]
MSKPVEILHAIEWPTEGLTKLKTRNASIKGWCFDRNGEALRGMRARVGDREFKINRKNARFAVGHMYQDCPLADYSGFRADIELPPGKSEVILEYKTQDKKWHELERLQFQTPLVMWPWVKPEDYSYASWVQQYDTLTQADKTAIRSHIETFERKPLLSVVMPVYNPPERYLRLCLDSVVNQLYGDWEFCIADDNSPKPHVRKVLEEYAARDSRIKVNFREENGHISAASNSAIELVTGEFIVLLDHDDELPLHALYLVANEILEHPEVDLIYSDEDKIDVRGVRSDPYFKPDWNYDLLTSQNCISHLGCYRTALIREIGGFRVGMEGSQDWDLALRVIEKSQNVRHIPHILYHWRMIEGSTAQKLDEKPYAQTAGLSAVEQHLERIGRSDDKIEVTKENTHWLNRHLPEPAPSVTLIIPTRNRVELLRPCIESITKLTDYSNYRFLVVDNESDDPETISYLAELEKREDAEVLKVPGPFNFSKLNNEAVQHCDTEFIGLINNDIEANHAEWLHAMVAQAVRPEIGAVGAKLHFREGLLQHAGIFLGYLDAAGHLFYGLPWSFYGHANRANMVQSLSAVTGACLVVNRQKYLDVGGLDEEAFAVAYNDVDLCLKLNEAGYRTLYTPFARLFHHESASRGEAEQTPERKEKVKEETRALHRKWGEVIRHDPGYNPNLTLESQECGLAFPPRRIEPWKQDSEADFV